MNLDNAPCYYFSSNNDGIILDVNETLCSDFGYARNELCGRPLHVLFPIATRIFHQTHFFPLLKMQGFANEIFITLLTKSKEQIPVIVNAKKSNENGSECLQYVAIAVHNRKKFEDELIAARKSAEDALQENTALQHLKQSLQEHAEQLDQNLSKVGRQNDELRQLNRIVTHDLQEPLRKLTLFSNLLISKSKLENETGSVFHRLIATTAQMRFVLSGVQQYVWLTESTPTLSSVNLADLLPDLQKNLEKEFVGASLMIELADVPILQADREQIELLFYQLLSNAMRFRKDDKVLVHIDGTMIQKNNYTQVKDKYSYQEFLRLRITDHGQGFDPAFKEQAFELFKRFHSVESRGLGLALCKKVIENHNGRITIDTKLNEGTTVTVLLPLQQAK